MAFGLQQMGSGRRCPMRRRKILTWACVFSLATLVAGGCDRRTPDATRRIPRIADTATEALVVDHVDSAEERRGSEELIGGWTPPAVLEAARSPGVPVRGRRPAEATQREPAPPNLFEEPRAELEPALPAPPRERPAVVPQVPRRAAPAEQPSWYTPPPKGPHETAIQVSIAIGCVAIGMGSTVAAGDGSPGERAFVIGAMGLGLASLSTALVLHWTEPAPKAAAKPTANVTVTPVGVTGTF
jgi:hypothetical protein